MKHIITILIIALSIPSFAKLQGYALIDSLEAELPNAKGDRNHVKLLKNLSFAYQGINSDKGIEYGEAGLKVAIELDWKKGMAVSYNSLAINHSIKSDYPNALDYWNKALKINKELEDYNGIAANLGNLGIVYYYQSDYKNALIYYNEALEINKKLGRLGSVATNLSNIGNIYSNQSDYPKALEYIHKALKIYEELGNKNGMASNLSNIGSIYRFQSDYAKALEYHHKALKINEELGNKNGIAITLGNIGNVYINLSQDSVSINPSELNQFVSINKDINLNNAINYTIEAVEMSKEIGELNNRSVFLKNLADVYKLKGEYKKWGEALEEHYKLKDSVFNQENQKKIDALTAQREKEEAKRLEMIAQEKKAQRNRLQYLGIGAVVVGFGVLLLLSGRMRLSEWMARALVFLSFIFLFEFILVIIDPWTDEYSEGIPLIKFAINMGLALIIFPMHQYFEKRVSLKVVKPDTLNTEQILEEFRKRKAEEG